MEVGKKYVHKTSNQMFRGKKVQTIYECHAILPSGAAVISWPASDWSQGGECILNKCHCDDYKEYVEPKKGTVYVAIMKRSSDDGFYSISSVDKSLMRRDGQNALCVASIEIPWTEGDKIDW